MSAAPVRNSARRRQPQDVDRSSTCSRSPGLVTQPAFGRYDPHEALHVEREPLAAGFQGLHCGRSDFAADRGRDQESMGLQPLDVLGPDRVGNALDRQDPFVDVGRRVFEAHQRRTRRVEGVDVDARGGEGVGNAGIGGGTARHRGDAKPKQPRGVRRVVSRRRRHGVPAARDRVLVVADRDEVVAFHLAGSLTRQSKRRASSIETAGADPEEIAGPKS
jgi:hypothetical protein